MEKKMLSISATLKEFWGMLLGADTHVFMDHKILMLDTPQNTMRATLVTQIEEFSPMLQLRALAIF